MKRFNYDLLITTLSLLVMEWFLFLKINLSNMNWNGVIIIGGLAFPNLYILFKHPFFYGVKKK